MKNQITELMSVDIQSYLWGMGSGVSYIAFEAVVGDVRKLGVITVSEAY